MFYNRKEVIQWITLVTIYIMIGLIGGYGATLILLFPILATPLALFLMSNRKNIRRDLMMHTMSIVAITLATQSIQESILYCIVIVLPAHSMAYMYRKGYTLPHRIMYIGTLVIGAFYLYIMIMKFFGVDYITAYMESVGLYKEMMLQSLNQMIQEAEQSFNAVQINKMNEMIDMNIMMLQQLYPTLFLVLGIILSTLYNMVITVIGRMKKWRMQPIVQITQFTFSRYMLLLLIIGVLIGNMGAEFNELVALGLNLQVFIIYLLEILGMISLIIIITRSKWRQSTKVLAIMSVILSMGTLPVLLIIAGLADVTFNYRKAKIII